MHYTFLRPSLKNNLFAVTQLSFERGSVGRQFFFFFFLFIYFFLHIVLRGPHGRLALPSLNKDVHFTFHFTSQTELIGRYFKYELKKGMTFIPVHSPFSSSSIYYSTFSVFLKGNTEEIKKLNLRTWNKKIFFRKTNKIIWVGAIFLGWSVDSKQKFFYGRPEKGKMQDKSCGKAKQIHVCFRFQLWKN